MPSLAPLKQLLSLFSPKEQRQLLGMLLLLFIGTGLETVSVGIIPAFVAILSQPELIQTQGWMQSLYRWSGSTSIPGFLLLLSSLLLLIFISKNLYLAALARHQHKFLLRKNIDLSTQLFSLYLKAPYTFHLQRNSADISLVLTSEMHKLFWQLLVPMATLISEITVTTFLVLLLIIVAPAPSFTAATFLGVAFFLFSKVSQKIVRNQGKVRQLNDGQLYKWINQGIGGIKETKILGNEKFFIDTFYHHKKLSSNALTTLELTKQYSHLYIETAVIATVLLIIIITLLQGQPLQSVLPTISLFAFAALRIMPSVKRMVGTITFIKFHYHVAELIASDLVTLQEINQNPKHVAASFPQPLAPLQKAITIENLSFAYSGTFDLSISDVSLTIPHGSSVAFVGPSGAGKSTLVDIILGLLEPTQGRVCADGKDIFEDLAGWQRQIGYIPQSIYLSDDTIRRNIAFGLPDSVIDDNKVWQALKAAQLAPLINHLRDGLDTIIGESGFRLSGGQRQRIGIARAIYHAPKILVMDEATAALDNDTEREFIEALETISHDKTLIMIAHRLTTVRKCDSIFFMANGKLIDFGSYDSLLKTCPDFRRIAAQDNQSIEYK